MNENPIFWLIKEVKKLKKYYEYLYSQLSGDASSATWGNITGSLSSQTDLQSALNAKANSASPTFTGTPVAPTASTPTSNTQVATTAFVHSVVDGITVPSAANPSATVGLTATNGTAATFLRSDATPALSQAIAPTWTGAHVFTAVSTGSTPTLRLNSTNPEFDISRSNNAVDAKRWNVIVDATTYTLRTVNDAGSASSIAHQITRSGNVVTNHSFNTSGQSRVTIANTGHVGIGVAPVGMLHIGQGTSAMTSPAGDQGIVLTNNQAYGNRLYFENLLGTSGQRMTMIGNYSNQMVFSSLNDTGTAFIHEGIIRLNAGTGTVAMKSMIGTGTRMVVTAADGTLSSQAIPAGTDSGTLISASASGDGSTTTFNVPHGLTTPTKVMVMPNSEDAKDISFAEIDGSNVKIVYANAPIQDASPNLFWTILVG